MKRPMIGYNHQAPRPIAVPTLLHCHPVLSCIAAVERSAVQVLLRINTLNSHFLSEGANMKILITWCTLCAAFFFLTESGDAQTHPLRCKNTVRKINNGSTYRSTDYGETWQKNSEVQPGISLHRAHTLASPPAIPFEIPATMLWEKNYMTSDAFGSTLIIPQAIYQNNDGSFVIGGDAENYHKVFIKTDASGKELYRSNYGNTDTAIDIYSA